MSRQSFSQGAGACVPDSNLIAVSASDIRSGGRKHHAQPVLCFDRSEMTGMHIPNLPVTGLRARGDLPAILAESHRAAGIDLRNLLCERQVPNAETVSPQN